MFLSLWCVLLGLCVSARALETSAYDRNDLICSQGLSECTMEDVIPLTSAEDTADVKKLNPDFKLCCKDAKNCILCLVIDTELYIPPAKEVEDEGHSGADEEDYSVEMRNAKASATVCYKAAATMPTCKKVEFTVNQTALTHRNQAKMTITINQPDEFPFSSRIHVYPPKDLHLKQEVVAPSLDDVCSQKQLLNRVPMCRVPTVSSVINQKTSQMELLFEERNNTLPSMCIQYEENGSCQSWNQKTIPLHYVAPCMCLQAWDEDEQSRRSKYCPFKKTDFPYDLQQDMWKNVSVHVRLGKMNDKSVMLLWNLSAPCRLEVEVWLCYKTGNCRGINNLRQLLENGTWRQNSKGHWENKGVFQNIDEQFSQCVMIKVKGMEHQFGPVCSHDTGRWRWSLLVVGVMLLVCVTALVFYFLHDCVKMWAWSWHHGGFVKVGRKGHVVLLSPPDVDDSVSESVHHLGSYLCNQGFSVSVDQWSRKEQCTLGPLPWLHSQLQKLSSMGGRVLLVLSHRALDRIEEWTHLNRDGDGAEPQQLKSPYSDLFTASLFYIHAYKQQSRAGEHFFLVKFDSQPKQWPTSDRRLPDLLHGLPLFHLPAQTQSLLTELAVIETDNGLGKRMWTGWMWGT
ncbi:interleukin-17 receptor C [Odontesthes bonariensis]|uniref:interleukin-17 receptor C n=1 Tax=Odontesthes bonariensis TaxID=219752 RepID=UPI003F5872D0